jgi:Uma2 family endonuclease
MIFDKEKKITVNEFLELDFEEGFIYELINGETASRKSSTTLHQSVSMNLVSALYPHIKDNKLGHLFSSPLDVFLNKYNLFVPDLTFTSNQNKKILKKKWIKGSPDLIIEILSKDTIMRDRGTKKNIYKKEKVKEYWIVDPLASSVEVYELKKNEYNLIIFATDNDEFQSTVLEGFKMNVKDIFNL